LDQPVISKVSLSMRQQEPLIGFQYMTDSLPVTRAYPLRHPIPPSRAEIS